MPQVLARCARWNGFKFRVLGFEVEQFGLRWPHLNFYRLGFRPHLLRDWLAFRGLCPSRETTRPRNCCNSRETSWGFSRSNILFVAHAGRRTKPRLDSYFRVITLAPCLPNSEPC